MLLQSNFNTGHSSSAKAGFGIRKRRAAAARRGESLMDGDSVVKGGSVMEAGEGRYEKAGGADGLNAFATGLKTVDGLCHPSGE